MLSLDDYKALSSKAAPLCKGVAQWLAGFFRDGEARGSNHLTPTNYFLNLVMS